MVSTNITKIFFRGNEIVALYKGDTLIFRKSGGGSTTEPTGVYTVRGTLKPDSRARNIQLCVNGKREQFDVNNDKTFEYTFVNVPITNMDYFTQACRDKLKTIDLSNFDTSQVTSMYEAFIQCSNLTSIDLTNVNTSKVTDMYGMFCDCYGLTSLDLSSLDTSNVTDISNMFTYNSALEDLYMNFNVRSVSYYGNIFYDCKSLKNVVGKFEGTKFDLDLYDCPLTAQSAMVFINGLATVTTTRTLKLSATTYDSLTNEQIAIATSKGWTVTRN